MRGVRNRRGFTLVESLLAIIVIAAIAASVAELMLLALDSYGIIVDRREALQRARLAINLMDSELQVIANPATDITTISSNQITFLLGGQSVSYAISGNRLLRQDSSGASVVADNLLPGSRFDFYTQGGGTTTNRTAVYRIHLAIGVAVGGGTQGQIMLLSNVFLRNRYYVSFAQQ